MANAFAYELGVFDPTFPGITLHFPNEAAWAMLQRVSRLYVNLAGLDLRQKHPELGDSAITPDQVLAHVMASPDNGVPLDPAQKERLGQAFMADEPEQAVANLAVASVHEHERRHFHDWMLSPLAAATNAIRTEVFLNHAMLEPHLYGGGTTVLPVPLPRWLRKSAAEQAELVEMWQGLLGESCIMRLPDLSHPQMVATLESITRRYKTIGSLFESIGMTGLDAAALFEASALTIQTQAINDLLGETAHNLFVSTMAQQSGSRYSWFLNAMNSARRPGETLENETLSTIATWCLLGNHTVDEPNANPVIRLTQATRHLQQHGFPAPDTPSRAILDALDTGAGCVPYERQLRASVELGDRILADYQAAFSKGEGPSRREIGILQCYGVLHHCHRYIVEAFLSDPDGYCKPTQYLDRKLESWPEPLVRHTFARPILGVPRTDLPRYERAVLFERESTDTTAFLRQYLLQPPARGVVDPSIADNWQFLCTKADTLFAETGRDRPDVQAERDAMLAKGVRLIELLD